MECLAKSVRFDARELHHLAPLLGFVGNEFPEFGGRAQQRCTTHIGKARLEVRIGERGVDFPVELADNFSGRARRHADAVPVAPLIAQYELADSWEVRQRLRALRGRYRERAELASPDILDRC